MKVWNISIYITIFGQIIKIMFRNICDEFVFILKYFYKKENKNVTKLHKLKQIFTETILI